MLGPAGRRVRCAKCGESWWQEPEEPQEAEAVAAVEAQEPPAIPEAPVGRADRGAAVNWPEIRSDPPFWATAGRGGAIAWGLLALLIAVVVIGGWGGRASIVGIWPASERMYVLLGLPPLEMPKHFDLRDMRSSWQDGGNVLVVEGRVVNVSDRTQAAPDIRLVLRDADGTEVFGTAMDLADTMAGAGGSETGGVAVGSDVAVEARIEGVPAVAVEAAVFVGSAETGFQPPS